MCAAKKQNSSTKGSAWPVHGALWLLGPGRPVLMALVLFGLFVGGFYWAWRSMRSRVLASPEYGIGLEQIEIVTPPPKWIPVSDIRAEVFHDLNYAGPLNVMDDNLPARIAKVFEQHPWVARVNSVRMLAPASVKVDLVYRRPVCMVEVPDGVQPVDEEGVLLPVVDFTSLEATQYMQLASGIREPPALPAGRRWNDARVIGGAEIAAALIPVWKELNLHSIVPAPPSGSNGTAGDLLSSAQSNPPGAAGNAANAAWRPSGVAPGHIAPQPNAASSGPSHQFDEHEFWLVTKGNKTRVYWGYAPGYHGAAGELSAAEKIGRLQRYAKDHETLDDPHGPRELDVRKLPPAIGP